MVTIAAVEEVLLGRPPAYVAGPVLGLCVVALYALVNQRLGVVGGLSELFERVVRRAPSLGLKGAFVLGVAGGGTLFALLTGGGRFGDGYGWLTREFAAPTTVLVLVGAGALIGYGAKTAGGCTSGNGLSGNAMGSRASFVATGTFFATAVAVSLLTALVFGANV